MNLVFSKSKEGTVHIAKPTIAKPTIAKPTIAKPTIAKPISMYQITKCGKCRGAK
jgi:hypothetical protein